jgi:eukaryotic-like serine/threonine-protein kinase
VESGELEGRVIAAKYAVLSVIGQGAMGVVYRAKQIALDKIVALKVLSADLRGDPEFVMRFHTEARAASRLDHPNSTRVLDFGQEPDGLLYIAMELLEGRTLDSLLRSEFPLAAARVAAIMSQTLSAVGAAHALKILHRDLKPENIVILQGRDDEDRRVDVVKVCDFGIAKVEQDPTETRASIFPPAEPHAKPVTMRATSVGVIVGTPQYMSPEQARGESLDVRSDLYTLGVVLYEMLTGRAPFDQGTPAEVLHDHVFVDPEPPSARQSGVDPSLEAICMRALKKSRDDRFASAREMRLALRALAEQPTDVATSAPSQRAFDTSAPTISAEPVAVAIPKRPRALRAAWLIPVTIAVGAAAVWLTPTARRPHTVAAISSTAAQSSAERSVQAAAIVEATAPTTVEAPRPRAFVSKQMLRANTHSVDVQPTAQATEQAVVPAPSTTLSTATPEVVAAVTVAPTSPPTTSPHTVTVALDPAQAHVLVGAVRAERVNVASVETALRHVDFTSCFRSEVGVGSVADGEATLALDMDDERVTRADLVGGAFSPTLRRCVSRLALGMRVLNVDTGDASAKVTLRFVLR